VFPQRWHRSGILPRKVSAVIRGGRMRSFQGTSLIRPHSVSPRASSRAAPDLFDVSQAAAPTLVAPDAGNVFTVAMREQTANKAAAVLFLDENFSEAVCRGIYLRSARQSVRGAPHSHTPSHRQASSAASFGIQQAQRQLLVPNQI
jgi:hypothetical protein